MVALFDGCLHGDHVSPVHRGFTFACAAQAARVLLQRWFMPTERWRKMTWNLQLDALFFIQWNGLLSALIVCLQAWRTNQWCVFVLLWKSMDFYLVSLVWPEGAATAERYPLHCCTGQLGVEWQKRQTKKTLLHASKISTPFFSLNKKGQIDQVTNMWTVVFFYESPSTTICSEHALLYLPPCAIFCHSTECLRSQTNAVDSAHQCQTHEYFIKGTRSGEDASMKKWKVPEDIVSLEPATPCSRSCHLFRKKDIRSSR